MNAIITAILERAEIYRNMMAAVARKEMTQPDAEELMRYMGEHNG
jgi:hypothetical protein